ncbi:VPLPA-CTERM sorting domain-containing protein [Methylobacter sp. S3L5C]|uniref:VPLPA-CTERM sorting domain-containing protein n=1 Tax=Methylobacter sp. S3L5C TaxID=2839024 RepID=UPI001FAD8635|nr:VPLPA-CTERM sorting domain-containing protein [Methylobacter sp. S3L5C]UOA08077.1 VPLPA-CTERM sorting domain-containing protein [Methylobacter sp. S3L5C]
MNKNKLFIAAVLMSTLCGQAEAASLVADGTWNEFDVSKMLSNSGNLEWIDYESNDALSFDFTLTGSAYLKVVDGGFAGDRYNVYDNGNLLGQTSVAVNTYPDSIGHDFDAASADSNFSYGSFLLGAGTHSITGLLSQSALDDSSIELNSTFGAVSLTAVPLPAAAWLYLTGTALMSFVARRRKTTL